MSALPATHATRGVGARMGKALSPKTISAVYVLPALFILFSVWIPDTFLTASTWKALMGEQAIAGIVAVGLVIPLAAGVFDLSIGLTVGFSSMLVAWFIGRQGVPIPVAVVGGVASGTVVGSLKALLINRC